MYRLVNARNGLVNELIDLIQIPIFVIEVSGERLVFKKLNKNYESKVGIVSANVENKTAFEFLPKRVAETIEDNYWSCVSSRKEYSYEEVLTLNGQEIWWSTTLSPVFDKNNEVRYIVGVAHDITKIKKTSIQLVKENSTLKRQNDDMNTLTAIAAHDLRPAIANVKSFAEFVMDGFQDLGDRKLESIQSIHSISGIMSDYVDRVLRHAGSVNIEREETSSFNIDHMIKDIIAASDPVSKFDIVYPSGHVEGEEVVVQIILRNLIDNAVRYAKSRIMIGIANSSERFGSIVLSVSDDGNGFPGGASGFKARLRVDRELHERTTGFGLRAVHQLTESREGLLWLDTPRLGRGATVCVSMPGRYVEACRAASLRVIEADDEFTLERASNG